MLFERIRRGQKPVFVFLAIMFGLGFVALGVGSGASGINLGDIFNTSSGGTGSISDLQSKTRDHPNDAPAWLQLAAAYQTNGQTDAAIGAYLRYIGLRPKDQNGLSGAATLLELRARRSQSQLTKAQALAAQYQAPASASAVQSPSRTARAPRPSSPRSARTISRRRPSARSSSTSTRRTRRTSSPSPRMRPPAGSTRPPRRRSRPISTWSRTSTRRPASSSSRRSRPFRHSARRRPLRSSHAEGPGISPDHGVRVAVFPAFSPYGTMRACRSRY
jgi:hypothetical protein